MTSRPPKVMTNATFYVNGGGPVIKRLGRYITKTCYGCGAKRRITRRQDAELMVEGKAKYPEATELVFYCASCA